MVSKRGVVSRVATNFKCDRKTVVQIGRATIVSSLQNQDGKGSWKVTRNLNLSHVDSILISLN
jgi:hypothetical protein